VTERLLREKKKTRQRSESKPHRDQRDVARQQRCLSTRRRREKKNIVRVFHSKLRTDSMNFNRKQRVSFRKENELGCIDLRENNKNYVNI